MIRSGSSGTNRSWGLESRIALIRREGVGCGSEGRYDTVCTLSVPLRVPVAGVRKHPCHRRRPRRYTGLSPASVTPSPQIGSVPPSSNMIRHSSVQTKSSLIRPGGSHCSPASVAPLPQTGSSGGSYTSWQASLQKRSSLMGPGGSHCSPTSITLSPHTGSPGGSPSLQ